MNRMSEIVRMRSFTLLDSLLWLSLLGSLAVARQQQPTPGAPATGGAPPGHEVPGLGLTPVCDPGNFNSSGPPFPNLPDQYSFTMEWNRNGTAVVTMYYDGPHDRGRLEVAFNGSLFYCAIFDYTLEDVFVIPELRNDCPIDPIADLSFLVSDDFGFEIWNGTIHIGSPGWLLEGLMGDTPTRYVGEEMVRGIPTHHWQTCFRGEVSYLRDYYFVARSWSYGRVHKLEATQMVPIQFTVNYPFEGRNVHNIYSITDFRTGPDSVPDSMFQVPDGLAYTGQRPSQPVPQVPEFFSTYVQQTSSIAPSAHKVETYRVRRFIQCSSSYAKNTANCNSDLKHNYAYFDKKRTKMISGMW